MAFHYMKNNKPNIVAMIPARSGSQRLKNKNLALIANKPLIYYAINAAKKSKAFNKISINSDNNMYKNISLRYKVDFYKRSKYLGGSNIKSDDIVYDFILKNPCDIIVWVNPIAPLQTSKDINDCISYFHKNKLNTLITTVEKKVHYTFNKKPINFKLKGKFSRTQDLMPLQEMVYSIMMWKTKSFIRNMKKNKSAILHGKIGYFNIPFLSSIIIKYEGDLLIAENILKTKNKKNYRIKYDRILRK